jgi:transposase-like protein
MSKAKRKRYTGAFKAKVGLDALMGVKTVGQIARDYELDSEKFMQPRPGQGRQNIRSVRG